jgi:hypothetical protein
VWVVGLPHSPPRPSCLTTGPSGFHPSSSRPWYILPRDSTFLTFASPSETRQVPCVRSTPSPPLLFRGDHEGPARAAQRIRLRPDSSLGVFQSPPLHRHHRLASTPGDLRRGIHRPGPARIRARSALAVPPGFDGLLRETGRRLVASCSRSWGSPPCGPSTKRARPRRAAADPGVVKPRHRAGGSRSRETGRRQRTRQSAPSAACPIPSSGAQANPHPDLWIGTRSRQDRSCLRTRRPGCLHPDRAAAALHRPDVSPRRARFEHRPPPGTGSGVHPDFVPVLVAHHPPKVSPRR